MSHRKPPTRRSAPSLLPLPSVRTHWCPVAPPAPPPPLSAPRPPTSCLCPKTGPARSPPPKHSPSPTPPAEAPPTDCPVCSFGPAHPRTSERGDFSLSWAQNATSGDVMVLILLWFSLRHREEERPKADAQDIQWRLQIFSS